MIEWKDYYERLETENNKLTNLVNRNTGVLFARSRAVLAGYIDRIAGLR